MECWQQNIFYDLPVDLSAELLNSGPVAVERFLSCSCFQAAAYLAAEDPEHRSPVMAPSSDSSSGAGVVYHPPKYQWPTPASPQPDDPLNAVFLLCRYSTWMASLEISTRPWFEVDQARPLVGLPQEISIRTISQKRKDFDDSILLHL